MENENKNAPVGRNSKKPNKHKSYFLTPNDQNIKPSANNNGGAKQPNKNHKNESENNISQKANNAPKEVQKEATPQNTSAPTHTDNAIPTPKSGNHNHRNRRRHRNHNNEKPHDVKKNTQEVAPETKSEPIDVLIQPSFMPKKSDKLEKAPAKTLQKFSDSSDYNKYSDYEEFSVEELYGDTSEEKLAEASEEKSEVKENADEPLVDVVGIRFKAGGKTYYFDPNGITLKAGLHAIVETARGLEYGEVALSNTKVKESETVPPLRQVVRIATDADSKHHDENKVKEDDAFRVCNEKINEHGLDMKLIDAQYTFDNSKLLFYFTSSGRVDFRNLVKDLAGVFRTRIELRQIGIRDEAKMIGGLGLCGRSLCCSLFLTDFGQVTIKMAKEQNLSLNANKISGVCGRLMCCLRYEHDTYEYEIKRTPPVDSLVRTVDGVGVVTEISPLAGTIKVRLNDSPEVPPKSYKRDEVTVLKKKKDTQ